MKAERKLRVEAKKAKYDMPPVAERSLTCGYGYMQLPDSTALT